MGEMGDVGAAGADMGGAADVGAAGADVGGGAADVGGGADIGGGADVSGLETTGEGGMGGGMLSFAVSESMANQGAGTAPSTTGIAAPTENVSGASTTPANANAQAGTGDIIRKNPFGGEAGTSQQAPSGGSGGMTTGQKVQKAMEAYQKGSKEMETQPVPINMSPGSGNTYAALFGSTMNRNNAPAAPPVPQIQTPGMVAPMATPPPVAVGGGLPPPMQMPNLQPAPAPPLQLGTVSDARAKQNIKYANADMDKFLQKVYDNVTKKGKK